MYEKQEAIFLFWPFFLATCYCPSVSPQIQHNYLYVFSNHMGTWLQKKSMHYSQISFSKIAYFRQ